MSRSQTDRLVTAVWRFLAETRARRAVLLRLVRGLASTARAEACASASAVRLDHPYFAGAPCTLLIAEVEGLWAPIAAGDDGSPFADTLDAVARMPEACGTAPASP